MTDEEIKARSELEMIKYILSVQKKHLADAQEKVAQFSACQSLLIEKIEGLESVLGLAVKG